jgi:uncharacterized protein (DUF362 family)
MEQEGAVRSTAIVSVLRTRPGEVPDSVRQAMEMAGWRRCISPGAEVSLKVNLGWDKLIPGAVSAPWVVEGVIRTIREHTNRIYLVESDQVVVDVEVALRKTGLDKICRKYDVEWVNMSRGRFVRIQSVERLVLKDVYIPEILTRTEVITLPVMKTHNKTVISGAIKNQWGCLQTLRHNFHLVLSEALVDVNAIIRPCFAVMDGTIALEGNGPKAGRPKEMNLVLASSDPVALDVIAAEIMGFDPDRIEHLRLCAHYGLGIADPGRIIVEGERVESVRTGFIPARHNAVSWLELVLRKSFVRRLVFNTPLFMLFCWGARRYYDLWDICVGHSLRNEVFRSSGYAAQWR